VSENEIPEGVMCGSPIAESRGRASIFYGMDDVGELDGILDEEDRYVVADQVPVCLPWYKT